MGAEVNAGTDRETTSLYTRVLDRHLERALGVMGEMLWKPRFEDLAAEREVVLEEIAMYEDDPQDRVFDVLGEAVFGDHPLGRAVIGGLLFATVGTLFIVPVMYSVFSKELPVNWDKRIEDETKGAYQ